MKANWVWWMLAAVLLYFLTKGEGNAQAGALVAPSDTSAAQLTVSGGVSSLPGTAPSLSSTPKTGVLIAGTFGSGGGQLGTSIATAPVPSYPVSTSRKALL